MKRAKGGDFVARPGVFSVGQHPCEYFAVPEARGDLCLEGFGIDAEEVKDVLVEGAVVGVFPVLALQCGPSLIQHAWEDH